MPALSKLAMRPWMSHELIAIIVVQRVYLVDRRSTSNTTFKSFERIPILLI